MQRISAVKIMKRFVILSSRKEANPTPDASKTLHQHKPGLAFDAEIRERFA
jgi:hypothetical protein